MSLMKFELKKILKAPVTVIAIIAVLLLNLYMLLLGSQDSSYCSSGAYIAPYQTDIARLQQEGAYFRGEINDAWFQKYYAEADAIRNDPANHVNEEERERIRQEDFRGYTAEAISELGSFIYMKESVLRSDEYQKYEDMEFSAHFYERAAQTGLVVAADYRERYPDAKGEAFAAKAEEMYNYMAQDYTAYYNYDLGYHKLRIMHTTFPLTIGLMILISLSPIFASEYSGKTDALLLTAKHGKRKLIYAKLKTGILFAILAWMSIELINTLLIFKIYGTAGAEAYWQNWLSEWAPFPWNQLQITLVTVVTSFLGAIFLSGVVMLISAFSKNQFISLLAGALVLLLPTFRYAFANSEIFQMIYCFLPANVLMGIVEWQWFDLANIFGRIVPLQVIILATSVLVAVAGMFVSIFTFRRHQVEN